MTLVRAYLLAVGGFSVVIGFAYMLRPVEMASLAELIPSTPTAVIDVQGFYGGQLVGLGVAMLIGLWKPRYALTGLVVAAASLGGTALGRLYGIAASGSCPPIIAGVLALEAACAILAGILWGRASLSSY
jgi:hypothetical protein